MTLQKFNQIMKELKLFWGDYIRITYSAKGIRQVVGFFDSVDDRYPKRIRFCDLGRHFVDRRYRLGNPSDRSLSYRVLTGIEKVNVNLVTGKVTKPR